MTLSSPKAGVAGSNPAGGTIGTGRLTCGSALHYGIGAGIRTALWEPSVEPTDSWMASCLSHRGPAAGQGRSRGAVERLASRAGLRRDRPRVERSHFLTETVPAGPKAAATAERARTQDDTSRRLRSVPAGLAQFPLNPKQLGSWILGPIERGPPSGTGDTKGGPLECMILSVIYAPDGRRL